MKNSRTYVWYLHKQALEVEGKFDTSGFFETQFKIGQK